MKIIVSGKGGSGKSTLSALIAKALSRKGYHVLLIDADESNLGLHKMMGISDPPVILMDNLGGKKGFKAKINNHMSPGGGDLFGNEVSIDTLPDECIRTVSGVKLLAIGKIHESGEGCACPMGMLSRLILSKFVIGEKDILLIDTSAGIEHFGRGIDEKCDLLLAVVDPTYESFMLAKKMADISDTAGMDIGFILNKVDSRVEGKMIGQVDKNRVIARIPNSDDIFLSSLEGRELLISPEAIHPVCNYIEAKMAARA